NIKYPYIPVLVTSFPRQVELIKNVIYNNRNTILYLDNFGTCITDHNEWHNDFIKEVGMDYAMEYMTLVLSANGRGEYLYYRNNILNNILTNTGTAYACYPSCRNFICEDNEITNVFTVDG